MEKHQCKGKTAITGKLCKTQIYEGEYCYRHKDQERAEKKAEAQEEVASTQPAPVREIEWYNAKEGLLARGIESNVVYDGGLN